MELKKEWAIGHFWKYATVIASYFQNMHTVLWLSA